MVTEAEHHREEDQPDHEGVQATATARTTPISLGARGPERAKVKKTAIMTAAAETTTRPEVRTEPSMACSGSADPSKRSLAAERRKRV